MLELGYLAGAAATTVGGILACSFHPRNSLFGPTVWKVPTQAPLFALTFDDGPHPEFTPAVAEILSTSRAQATFFCVGERVKRFVSVAELLHAQGHDIQNHTYSHNTASHLFRAAALTDDLRASQRIISGVTKTIPKFYRPAVGIRNPAVHRAARAADLEVVTWSRSARDGGIPFSEKRARALASSLRPGDIVTLHDGTLSENRKLRVQTLAALPVFLNAAQERGLQAVSLSRLVAERQ